MGSRQSLRRSSISWSERATSSLRFSTSKVILSPSFSVAIGPRWAASGATWPAIRPWVAPEKRPSVRRATDSPKPSPTRAAVTPSISRIPGPPLGPSYLITTTSPSSIRPLVTASIASSSESKTRAGPSWNSRVCPETLITQPSGARLPLRITSPPVSLRGLSTGTTTSWPGVSCASSASSAMEVQARLPRRHANHVLARVVSRGARRAHGREADELERHRHRVRRELATAGARAGARVVLEVLKVLVCHPPRCVGTHGLEDILDRHVPVLESTRGDGSSVDHEAGDAQTDESHRRPRHGLVASYEGDDGVEHVTAAHELYRVRYHLAAYQRGLHPLGAHSNAVGDSDGVELHRRTPCGPDALLDPFGKPALVKVAGHGFDPGVRHPDYRLAP